MPLYEEYIAKKAKILNIIAHLIGNYRQAMMLHPRALITEATIEKQSKTP
jgi:hypothetical protein